MIKPWAGGEAGNVARMVEKYRGPRMKEFGGKV
jgi:hypothetical protein